MTDPMMSVASSCEAVEAELAALKAVLAAKEAGPNGWLVALIVIASISAYVVVAGFVRQKIDKFTNETWSDDSCMAIGIFFPVAIPAILLWAAGVWLGTKRYRTEKTPPPEPEGPYR